MLKSKFITVIVSSSLIVIILISGFILTMNSELETPQETTNPPTNNDHSEEIIYDKNLIWAEEFNYTGLPNSNWFNYETFEPDHFNQEAQKYLGYGEDVLRVENDTLIIEALSDEEKKIYLVKNF